MFNISLGSSFLKKTMLQRISSLKSKQLQFLYSPRQLLPSRRSIFDCCEDDDFFKKCVGCIKNVSIFALATQQNVQLTKSNQMVP
jgi:hypothetical protein